MRPSPSGETARERWPSLDADVEGSVADDVATPLRDVVRQLYLEWPHFPTGYGPADHSITGGLHTSGGGKSDSKVPTHGTDWVPVPRHDVEGSSVAGLAVSALLSQAFVAFAADFEELRIGGLHLAASALRLLPDGGVPVSDIPMLSRLKGDGKSVLERHGYVEITRDPTSPRCCSPCRRHVASTRVTSTNRPSDGSRMAGGPSTAPMSSPGCEPRSSPSMSTDRCRTR